jgi:hypothetical protein
VAPAFKGIDMLKKEIREEINACLRKVLIAARESHNMDIEQAARFTGLSEQELIAVETFPAMISVSTLYGVMKSFDKVLELADANNEVSLIAFRAHKMKHPKFEYLPSKYPPISPEAPPPQH